MLETARELGRGGSRLWLSRSGFTCRVVGVCTVSRVRARSAALTDFNSRSLKDRTLSERRSRRARTPALYAQLWSIMHSSWIFPRDNEWIFRGYRALMDLGSNSGLCLRAEAPPDLGRLLESGPALRTVWTVVRTVIRPVHREPTGDQRQRIGNLGERQHEHGHRRVRWYLGPTGARQTPCAR